MGPLSGVSPVDQRRIVVLLRAALDHLRDGAPLPADAEPFVKHTLCYQPPCASALLPAPLRRALERSGEQLVALNAHIDGLQEAVAACAPLPDDGRVRRELVAAKQSVSTVLKVRLLGAGRGRLANALLVSHPSGEEAEVDARCKLRELLASGCCPGCDVSLQHLTLTRTPLTRNRNRNRNRTQTLAIAIALTLDPSPSPSPNPNPNPTPTPTPTPTPNQVSLQHRAGRAGLSFLAWCPSSGKRQVDSAEFERLWRAAAASRLTIIGALLDEGVIPAPLQRHLQLVVAADEP